MESQDVEASASVMAFHRQGAGLMLHCEVAPYRTRSVAYESICLWETSPGYEVMEKISASAYRLRLPASYQGHPVLNIAHLEPYVSESGIAIDRPKIHGTRLSFEELEEFVWTVDFVLFVVLENAK